MSTGPVGKEDPFCRSLTTVLNHIALWPRSFIPLTVCVPVLCLTEQHPTPEVLAALAARTLEVLPQFEAQHLSNTLLGAAKLEWDPGAEFLDALAQEALKKLESFTAQVAHNNRKPESIENHAS